MFQARATQLLKKLNWNTPFAGRHSKDALSIVSTSTNTTPSPDVLSKPDMSNPLAGFRLDDTSIPTDTDDSSSSNSPTRQSRRYSAWDGLTQSSSVSPVFAAHGPAPLFIREVTASDVVAIKSSSNEGNILAPAPLFLLSSGSTDRLRATGGGLSRSATPSNMPVVLRDTSSVPDESPQLEISQTLRSTEALVPSNEPNEPITIIEIPDTLAEPESSQAPVTPALSTSLATPPTTIQGRRSPGSQLMTTLPPPFRVATERGLRLSPSIIARQPMPILRLPALPVPTPAAETIEPPAVRLRHVPSLSVHGRPDINPESDEDDDDVEDDSDYGDEKLRNEDLDHQSDEDGDGEEMRSLGTGYPLSHSPLREFQSSVIGSTPPPVAGPSSGPFLQPYWAAGATSTPRDESSSNTYGKFLDTTPTQDVATTPKPFSPKASLASIHRRRVTPMASLELNGTPPSMQVSREHSLYRAPSRSMVNLSASRKDLRLKRKKSHDSVHSSAASVSGNTVESDTDRMIGKLLRRTSMPTFTSASDPPPYPSFDPRPQKSTPPIQYRDDEGREPLPHYSNSLYLSAIMPRKMEFSAPGVQAKDRKWRRVFCELEGTMLRVYKCPPGASGAGIIGEWWERRVGVGDLTSGHYQPRRKPDEAPASSSKMAVEQVVASPTSSPPLTPHSERSESQSSRATSRSVTPSTSRANRRMSGASFLASWRNGSSSIGPSRGRGVSSTGQPGTNGGMELLPVSEPTSRRNSLSSSTSHEDTPEATSRTPRARSRLSFLSSRMQLRSGEIQKPSKGDLIRAYTLQYAESGLGNDYVKRKNVIRVRLEGEQFLLQAADVPSVVEWIEVSLLMCTTGRRLQRLMMGVGFPCRHEYCA